MLTRATAAGKLLHAAARSLLRLSRTLQERADRLDGTPDRTTYTFSYPALLAFKVTCDGGEDAALRLARIIVAELAEHDTPLIQQRGPLPAEPHLHDVSVWLGSAEGTGDTLLLEI